jgi:hypothetical protein
MFHAGGEQVGAYRQATIGLSREANGLQVPGTDDGGLFPLWELARGRGYRRGLIRYGS